MSLVNISSSAPSSMSTPFCSASRVIVPKTGTLGLTVAGKVNLVHNELDLQGQVIPVYIISKVIGAIPLIGDILTGGNEGGLFAATYTVKGPLAKPDMSVNPVSVLAPGIIRDILFTDPNIAKDKPPAAPEAPEAKTP